MTVSETFLAAASTSDRTRRPGRPRSAAAEKAILDAAVELVAEEGVSALNIEAVAQRARVAKTTIYRRWENKADLLSDAIAKLKGPAPIPPGDSVREDLIWILCKAQNNARRTLVERVFLRLAAEPDGMDDLVEMCRQRTVVPRRNVTKDVLRRGVSEGIVSASTDLDLVAELLIAPILVAVTIRRSRYSDSEIAYIVDIILGSVKPPKPTLES